MVLFVIRIPYRTTWKSRSGWTNNISPCHLCLGQIFSSGYVVHFESSMSVQGQVIPQLPSGVIRADLLGRWAIEVADDYPRTRVIGLDLSPIQPEQVPENCEFIIGDLTECLADFHDCSFDLVHSRFCPVRVSPGC